MKIVIHILVFSLSFLMMMSCAGRSSQPSSESGEGDTVTMTRTDSVGMLVTHIRKCSRLYASEFKIHRIITHDDELKLKGSILGISYDFDVPAGSRRIAIPIDATLKGFIDFQDFDSNQVIFDDGKIEIILPDPQVELTSTKINHEEVESYVALFRSNFSDKELSRYEAEGRASIIESIPELKISDRTRASVSRVLIPMIRQLGFHDDEILITFRKDFNDSQLKIIQD